MIFFLSLDASVENAPLSRQMSSTIFISSSTAAGWPSTSIMQMASQSGRPTFMHLLTALIVTESMSSIADGRSGLAMMLDTHLPASTSELNAATVIAEALGFTANLSVTSVMTPKVPSLPTMSLSS